MKTAYWGIFAALPALLLCGCGENSSQKKNNISRNSYLAYRNDSLNNLKHIGMGIIIYAYYHNDNAPANLTDLEGYVGNLFFVAKFDKKHHQPEDNHISQAESSYAYIGNITPGSLKKPVIMRSFRRFKALCTTRYETVPKSPKRQAASSNPVRGANAPQVVYHLRHISLLTI